MSALEYRAGFSKLFSCLVSGHKEQLMHTDSIPVHTHTNHKISTRIWKSPHLIRQSLAKEEKEHKTHCHFDMTTKEDAF